MDLSVHLVRFGAEPATIGRDTAEAARVADAAGIASLSFMDHYFQMDRMYAVDEPMLEGYTSLGFVAAHTSRLKLGLLVTGVTYRHPGLLAKIVTTLDVLSEGRAELGIGAAWYEREHAGLGVPFPPLAERFERLEETLQICRQMWSPDDGPFNGKHYQLAETLCSPRPVSEPRPSILVGGGGERKTLRLVAQYADACNLFASSPDAVAHKLDVLRRHCADLNRDDAEIRKTVLYAGSSLAQGDSAGFLAEMRKYATLGVDEVVVVPPAQFTAQWIESTCVPLIAELAELDGAG
jgi:F420-dependent oxidoreductase-like protein